METQQTLDRVLPHDLDAERAVLGSMLLDVSAIDTAKSIICDGFTEFWSEKHGELFKVISDLHDIGKPIDDVVIRDEMVRVGTFDKVGGYDFLADCVNSVSSHFRIAYHSMIVHEHYIRRRVIRAAAEAMDSAFENSQIPDIFQGSIARFERVGELVRASAAENPSVDELVTKAFDKLMSPIDRTEVLSTGLVGLDEIIYGLKPQQLSLIGARPSRGKTALALVIADYVATTSRVPTLFFTLEMSPIELATRLVLGRAGLSEYVLRSNYAPDLIASLALARQEVSESLLHVRGGEQTLDDLIAASRLAVKKLGVKLIVIDYLGLIEVPGKFERYDLLIGHVTRRLKKRVAQALNVHVLLCAQLNRKTESENRPPRMSDFRDSDRIAFDADIIILPWQEVQETPGDTRKQRGFETGKVDLIVDKHRNGRTGVATVWWRAECARFENYVEQDVYVQQAQ